VSAVENGHIVPSLAGLILLSRNLGVAPGSVLDAAISAGVLANPHLVADETRRGSALVPRTS
jgi:hypothetical protein